MQIQVRYFAAAREAVGQDEESLEVPGGTTVAAVLDGCLARHPDLVPLAPHLRFAVGERFVNAGTPIKDGDTVAILPPVSGG